MPEQNPPAEISSKTPGSQPSPRPRRTATRRWLIYIGVIGGSLLVVGGITLGGAEYYTSRPQFCGTCHVMDPYYESWSRDVHGAKFGVRCIDCHYAPGEQHTFRAKFRGLSQVASYFSGRYGAGRPRAHVDDASCMRSGCHGGQAFAPKMLLIGEPRTEKRMINDREVELQRAPSVHFVHARHLDVEKTRADVEKQTAEVRARLKTAIGDANFERIKGAATSVRPAGEREATLRAVSEELGLSDAASADALTLQKLEHRRVRIDQLAGLNCSACHAFNAKMTSHIAADRQVCFTCHFTHEEFNRETGECLRCHEPPTRTVSVHAAAAGPKGGQGVLMDHQDIVRRGVNCASCHMDVLRGAATVSERDCTHCHDQARFLAEFAARTTDTVRMYHAVHIAGQKAHCFDCHRAVQHGLVPEAPSTAAHPGFLEPVLNDCQHCHPKHHSEQVSLLTGTGGAGGTFAQPNAMVGSRLNCRACHTQSADDQKGDALFRATREGCVACHSDDYLKLFDQWKHEIQTNLDESEAALTRLSATIVARRQQGESVPENADAVLSNARQNIQLVRNGGGLHNRPFSIQLLDTARREMSVLEAQLSPTPR